MMRELMSKAQQSQLPMHTLGAGRACTLAASRRARWLLVAQGRVWLTGVPTTERGGDLWLHGGEWVQVPAGAAPVLEALPEGVETAAFLLLEASRPWVQALSAGLATRWVRHRPTAAPGAWFAGLRLS